MAATATTATTARHRVPSLQSFAYFRISVDERALLPDFIRDDCLARNLRDLDELIHQRSKPYVCYYKHCTNHTLCLRKMHLDRLLPPPTANCPGHDGDGEGDGDGSNGSNGG